MSAVRSAMLCMIVIAAIPSSAQTRHIELRHISTVDGLSENTVYCIEQDRYGFMWFGTQTGLNQYDGYRFTVYRNDPRDSTSLSHDYINALHEDPQGVLWIGTNAGGLNRFNRFQNRFDVFRNDPEDSTSLPNDYVQCLFTDRDGRFWVGTAAGLACMQSGSGSFRILLRGYSIRSVYEDARGRLWVGTSLNGLFRLDSDGNSVRHYVHDPQTPDGLRSNDVRAVAEDSDGNIWVGTIDGGMHLYLEESDTFVPFRHDAGRPTSLRNNTVFTLYLNRNGVFLAGLENGGIQTVRRTGGPSGKPEAEFHSYVKEFGIFGDGMGNA